METTATAPKLQVLTLRATCAGDVVDVDVRREDDLWERVWALTDELDAQAIDPIDPVRMEVWVGPIRLYFGRRPAEAVEVMGKAFEAETSTQLMRLAKRASRITREEV